MAYAVPPATSPEVAMFYQTTVENLPGTTTNNVLGFNSAFSWNSPIVTNQYNSGTDTSTFIVNASGLYQIEGHCLVQPNGATWTNATKGLYIAIQRGVTNPGIIANTSAYALSGANYGLICSGTFLLQVGDQVTLNHQHFGVTGTPQARALENGFDLNTWISFTFIKAV